MSQETDTGPDEVRQEARVFGLGWILQAGRDLIIHLAVDFKPLVLAVAAAALIAGGGWATVNWLIPALSPAYKTQFLIDTSADATDIAGALGTAVGNSGDDDALGLRSFGGECGRDGSTTRLVDFGTGNRSRITDAARRVPAGGRPTLVKGIVEAAGDFSGFWPLRATQVNRVVVVTRHGADACDAEYAEDEIRQRIASAGLKIQFRLVGYRVPDDQRDRLSRIASAAGAPEPVFTETPEQLRVALDWLTNTEPVRTNAYEVIRILDPTAKRVDAAVAAIGAGRLDVAERELDRAGTGDADAQLKVLADRARTPATRDIYRRAIGLRDLQKELVPAARDLLGAARSKGVARTDYNAIADRYNHEVDAMNRALAALRLTLPKAPR
ncbi:hypothetical protein [Microbispora sp. NBRC 16548]|uniref:hypothetical protein n=1 Tax=Microbispora sp. NBRC 16548 TaxID=3030994 RepID=UPI00249FFAE6|nr:hypothetical protein [Microbispora sp. NBRC 16548]GLX03457.1 hypothetical protein Misp03_03840 [Microbispora sp. NBRC 16548]